MSELQSFQGYLNQVIPLTRALGINLDHYDGQRLDVSAPLALNHNHQGTGFGGSLYSVAVVAAWGLLELWLRETGRQGSVVIQSGEMDYRQPATADFLACAQLPLEADFKRFADTFDRKGRARLNLASRVYAGPDEPVAVFEGRFVVLA